MIKKYVRSMLFVLGVILSVVQLSGCASIGVGGGGAGYSDAITFAEKVKNLSRVCTKHEDRENCLSIQIFSLKYDSKNPLYVDLDKSVVGEKRIYRAKELPMVVYRAYTDGQLPAAQPAQYDVYFWNINTEGIDFTKLLSYRLNGTENVSDGKVEEVTTTAPVPNTPLGKPMRVFRVSTEGKDAGAVSLEVPKLVFTENTSMMVTSVDGKSYYPGDGKALWVQGTYFKDVILKDNWFFTILFFVRDSVSPNEQKSPHR